MNEEQQNELEFLRFFFDQAYNAFGPADADILSSIVARYKKKTGKKVDPAYDWSEEE